MNWEILPGILIAVFAVIGSLIAFRKRGKAGHQKREELHQHLKGMGIQASLAERNNEKEGISISRASGRRSEGLITVENSNIDSINVISVSSQYGTNYFLDYLVKSPKLEEKETIKKVKLVKKKSSPLRGKVVDIEWKGTNPLAQRLNFDYRLEDMLIANLFKGSIEIVPEPKWGYTCIRTAYFLPVPDLFKAIDLIAKNIRTEYGHSKGKKFANVSH